MSKKIYLCILSQIYIIVFSPSEFFLLGSFEESSSSVNLLNIFKLFG